MGKESVAKDTSPTDTLSVCVKKESKRGEKERVRQRKRAIQKVHDVTVIVSLEERENENIASDAQQRSVDAVDTNTYKFALPRS